MATVIEETIVPPAGGTTLPPGQYRTGYDAEAATRGFWSRGWENFKAGVKSAGNWFMNGLQWLGRGLGKAWSWTVGAATSFASWVGSGLIRAGGWAVQVVPSVLRRVIAWPIRIISGVFGSVTGLIIIGAAFVIMGGGAFMDWYAKHPHDWITRMSQNDTSVPTGIVDGSTFTNPWSRKSNRQSAADAARARAAGPVADREKYYVVERTDGVTMRVTGPKNFAPGNAAWEYLFGENLSAQDIYDLAITQDDILVGMINLAEPQKRYYMADTVFEILLQAQEGKPLVSLWYGRTHCALDYVEQDGRLLEYDVLEVLKTLKDINERNRDNKFNDMDKWYVHPQFERGYLEQFDALIARYAPDRTRTTAAAPSKTNRN